jgi:aminoglycoside phosphotransferase (APT) family kinase protein
VIRVSTKAGRGWIVKQASPLDATHVRMLDREAAFCRMLDVLPWTHGLRSIVPRLRAYDPGVHALIVQYLPHETAWNYLRRKTANAKELGSAIGRTLARAHVRVPSDVPKSAMFSAKLPWILQLNRVPAEDISEPATRALLDVIRSDSWLTRRLVDLERGWRIDTLIHGDAKLDNVIVKMSGRCHAWLVDWAFAGEGDPAWDVGSTLQSALVLWLYGVDVRREHSIDESVSQAAFPVALVQSFAGALLESYRAARELTQARWRLMLPRVIRYSGVALMQSALGDARSQQTYSPRQIVALQMGKELIAAPLRAMREFLDTRA